MLRSWRVLYIFTSKCAFRHSGVQFLMSPLGTFLRTRRFNKPTFGLTRHTNLWKNTAFRDFSNIWRGCIFFLLTFWLLHLLSTDLTTLLLLFNSPYCRKFLFKLPSTKNTPAWPRFQVTNPDASIPLPKLLASLGVSELNIWFAMISWFGTRWWWWWGGWGWGWGGEGGRGGWGLPWWQCLSRWCCLPVTCMKSP